ncbi:MAG: tetraacyldisaccharide 4'-kinase [Polyangiales bacterium]
MRAIARLLERGAPFAASAPWDPVRRLDLPDAAVVGVGGARLGGSGRTPLAVALARALGATLIGHAHGARPERPRFVQPDDRVAVVGDEALIAARAGVPVIVAPRRSEALAFASKHARVLVVDRLLQARPHRLACAVLAHDHAAKQANPWPFGDLVASWERLHRAADEHVEIGGPDAREEVALEKEVDSARIGLVTSLARPARVLSALSAMGIRPRVHVERDDHARLSGGELRRLAAMPVDVWLVDAKTRAHAPDLGVLVRHQVVPSAGLVERVRARLPRP